MKTITCIISTSKSEVVSKPGDMIVLPGESGELGVLYNHIPMVVELVAGKIRVYNGGHVDQEIEIGKGIAYIRAETVEIFL